MCGYYIRTRVRGDPGVLAYRGGEIRKHNSMLYYIVYHVRCEVCSETLFNLPVSDVLVLFIVLYCVDRGLSYDRRGTTTRAVK